MRNVNKLDIINSNPPVILVNGERVDLPFPHYGEAIDAVLTVLEATADTVVAEEFECFEADEEYIHWEFEDYLLDNC